MDLKKKAAILARVSREVQETESQISVLKQCANDFGFEVPDEFIFQEKITGMDSYDKEERQSLRDLKDAIETLAKLMKDTDTAAQTRANCAVNILQYAGRFTEITDFADRLEALEKANAENGL